MKQIIAALFCILPLLVVGNTSAQSDCSRTAQRWITALQSPKATILQNHCDSSCSFSAEWVQQIDTVTKKTKRERTCYDLVLLWSHKDCMYFRDVIDETAYYPCKAWSREMFHQCMSGNTEWFLNMTAD